MKLYPRASENRKSVHDPDVRPRAIAFLKQAFFNLLILQLLFLCLFAYVFGSLYQQTSSVSNFRILFVDFDGGAVGAAVRTAYANLQNSGFPTLEETAPTSDTTAAALREEVCSVRYWAAFYVVAGASDRLADALAGGAAAHEYDAYNAVRMIWNEARYPTVADPSIEAKLELLSTQARTVYLTANASSAAHSANVTDPAAAALLANPWILGTSNIQATTQGPRVVYNTLVLILVLIQEFFYLGTVNGLYERFRIFAALRPRRIITVRCLISLSYALVGSLCLAGMIWAFRVGWHVSGSQFVLTWLSLWLFGHLNFLVLDILTVWLAPPYVPMALITWVILNVTSVLLPFELSPGFYRWGYALPGHEVFQTLLDVWSGGCNPRLHVALPVLFAWWIVGMVGSGLGVYRRCHYAVVAAEQSERSFQAHVQTALEHERERDRRRALEAEEVDVKGGKTEDQVEEQQLESIIRGEDRKLRQMDQVAGPGNFAFSLAYSRE